MVNAGKIVAIDDCISQYKFEDNAKLKKLLTYSNYFVVVQQGTEDTLILVPIVKKVESNYRTSTVVIKGKKFSVDHTKFYLCPLKFVKVYSGSIENSIETIKKIRMSNVKYRSQINSKKLTPIRNTRKTKAKNNLDNSKSMKKGPLQREKEKMKILKCDMRRQKKNSKIVRIFDDASHSHDFLDRKYKLTNNLQLVDSSNNHVSRNHDYIETAINIKFKINDNYKVFRYSCFYCHKCNKFFDFKSSFDQQFSNGNIREYMLFLNVEHNGKHTMYDGVVFDKFDDLKYKETHLHSLGYRVGKSGIGSTARRELLKRVISKRELTVGEIKQILNHNIKFFSGRKSFETAVMDWKEDLKYVNEIVVGHGR